MAGEGQNLHFWIPGFDILYDTDPGFQGWQSQVHHDGDLTQNVVLHGGDLVIVEESFF